jgi:hypothetical protein
MHIGMHIGGGQHILRHFFFFFLISFSGSCACLTSSARSGTWTLVSTSNSKGLGCSCGSFYKGLRFDEPGPFIVDLDFNSLYSFLSGNVVTSLIGLNLSTSMFRGVFYLKLEPIVIEQFFGFISIPLMQGLLLMSGYTGTKFVVWSLIG